MSLRTKLLLWNGVMFLLAITLFGVLQLAVSRRAALAALEHEMIGRADSAKASALGGMGPGFGPPPFRGPNGNGVGALHGPQGLDVRRPRFFTREGEPVALTGEEPWSQDLLEASANGSTLFGDVTKGGVQLHVYSTPFDHPQFGPVVLQVAQETDSLAMAQQAQVTSFAAVLPLIVLFSLVMATLLSRLVLRPVAAMTQTAEAIAQNPNLRERLDVPGQDEIARLSWSFNMMTDQLQESNAQLSEALESQRRFTGDAAHELRTPLTSILLASENGLHPDADDLEREASLKTVLRSAQSMQKLTQMLLTLSRLDAGPRVLERDWFDLANAVRAAVSATGLQDDHRLRIDVGEGVQVWGSADATLQILSNLLENGSVYTPHDGTLTVRIVGNSVEVADTGEGVAPEHLGKLFDRFFRVDPSRSRAKGGHGLGLAISRLLAEAQGAKLNVTSTVGVGTTFRLEFQDRSQPS